MNGWIESWDFQYSCHRVLLTPFALRKESSIKQKLVPLFRTGFTTFDVMVVISKAVLREFTSKYNEAKDSIAKWYNETKLADWNSFADVKRTFNSVDAVGNHRYVFNIKGNKFRLIALILFSVRTVFILFIGTHKAYDLVNAGSIALQKNES